MLCQFKKAPVARSERVYKPNTLISGFDRLWQDDINGDIVLLGKDVMLLSNRNRSRNLGMSRADQLGGLCEKISARGGGSDIEA